LLSPSSASVEVVGSTADLPSRLPVEDIAIASVGAALTMAAELQRQRTTALSPAIQIDASHVAAAFRSDAHLRMNGQPVRGGFAPLSRYWRAADGWVRTHANYPWHRQALLGALGARSDAAVASLIGERSALSVENDVVAAGGVAAAVRTVEHWQEHPQGQVCAHAPLIGADHIDGAAPRRRETTTLPASGLRVLDLTRVIAGPVATRYLAAPGADVLRVDPPHHPELPAHIYDGLLGKRSTTLDARTATGLKQLHALLDGADIVVHGYRPGALRVFGLDLDVLAERHPGLVTVTLSAWGRTGPWGSRRGFDSIVQSATGIAAVESTAHDRPGALLCQLLDHATGYLAAAAALEGVRRQSRVGGTHTFDLSLAATATWLLAQPRVARVTTAPSHLNVQPSKWSATLLCDEGTLTAITPPGRLGRRPLRWPDRLPTYGGNPPTW